MAEVEYFAYGWINPVLAYSTGFLGALLGLALAARAREARRWARVRWLLLSGVALGGTGLWLAQFMALLGVDVPSSPVRYDPAATVSSAAAAVIAFGAGLIVVGFGRPTPWRVVLGGAVSGVGVATAVFLGLGALRVAGVVSHDQGSVAATVVVAVLASTVTMWLVATVRGARGALVAALLVSLTVGTTQYAGLWSTRVTLAELRTPPPGLSPFVLLVPVCVVACLMVSGLAYATVGYSVRRENAREEALLAHARQMAVRGRFPAMATVPRR